MWKLLVITTRLKFLKYYKNNKQDVYPAYYFSFFTPTTIAKIIAITTAINTILNIKPNTKLVIIPTMIIAPIK